MLVSFNELKSKLDKEKLKQALPKLPWRQKGDGYHTWCYFKYKHGKVSNQVDDDCFLHYPSPICANFESNLGVVKLTSFMWMERTGSGGVWRYVREEDGTIPFFTPGSYAEQHQEKGTFDFTVLEF